MPSKPLEEKKKVGLLRRHFKGGTKDIMDQINASISFDQRLYKQDIRASQAHCGMLVAQGILSEEDGQVIKDGLEEVLREFESGALEIDPALEDVHMHVEARLTEIVGEAGKKLHTARSRNDQVATDFRLWIRDSLDVTDTALKELQRVLLKLAEDHVNTIMPGFTHSQPAQPIVFAHHLLAYVEMFGRDRGRVSDARQRMNECPLGAAALAGTSFPIERSTTAAELGFDRPTANSVDSVSDRDFVAESLAMAAISAAHLSRLAEELVLWSSPAFGFVRFPDAFSTGSSIMPQKRNPDAAELVRGKSGRMMSAFFTVLTLIKGLPLAYAKDLQEDKEPTFDSLDSLLLCLRVMTGVVDGLEVGEDRMRELANTGYLTATDLADWLVRVLGMAFRDAYNTAGGIVKIAEERSCELSELSLNDLREFDQRIDKSVFEVLSLDKSVASRTSQGGTAPEQVSEALSTAKLKYL
ncbi:MAG: argininosuccinate lyase [Pseudomonadota bacterium]|nr:argininosuccinate lyase [Pseudomonadota bacterium]